MADDAEAAGVLRMLGGSCVALETGEQTNGVPARPGDPQPRLRACGAADHRARDQIMALDASRLLAVPRLQLIELGYRRLLVHGMLQCCAAEIPTRRARS